MPHLRPFRAGDEAALAEVCLRTADAGADGTGILDDDDIWGAVFVLPYAARHPGLAFVVETDDGRVAGYIVGTDDTDAFEEWFRSEWWPRVGSRWPRRAAGGEEGEGTRQDAVLAYADSRRPGAEPYAATHPAHLHIDLLPELQGQGWGRRLIAALVDALRARGVAGLHLVAAGGNAGAIAFYERIGFSRLDGPTDVAAFGLVL
ncbi:MULTISPECIES: GNAT family N-acetyltransferase [Microbacterium]|uniref:GNAT family N-acetyltransferase n=1 Tax=Microbacterium hominis TaxID=162426 RepID=A0A2K9D5B4_9MICO|nr:MULTISPECIES: GNAT family N-acetyltransferase [Microbacterium]AUG28865.1 GNAT family N-acetyltransferase [Microbacterium hominis]